MRAEWSGGALPGGIEIVEDVTLPDLDPEHTAPNRRSVILRGIWCPPVRGIQPTGAGDVGPGSPAVRSEGR